MSKTFSHQALNLRQKKPIRIGTRGSQLSLVQTDIVKQKLSKLLPGVKIEIKIITTTGDKNMNPVPLDSVGKGWFTKEIDKALLEGSVDIAVHSLKDLPEMLPPGLVVAAIPEREDAREALVAKGNLLFDQLKPAAVIGTDSTRRASQILRRRPDLIVKSVRGNVNRRLEKLETEEYDALFLAVAGLKRLGLSERITQYFEADDFVPAPGQGALAVVALEKQKSLQRLLSQMNDLPTLRSTRAERAFSKVVGGGCKMPVGAYAFEKDDVLTLVAFIGSPNGKHQVKDSLTGPADSPESLGEKLAKQMLIRCEPWYKTEVDEYSQSFEAA